MIEYKEFKADFTPIEEGKWKTRPVNLMCCRNFTKEEWVFCKTWNNAIVGEFNRNKGDLVLYAYLQLNSDEDKPAKLKIQEFVAKPYTSKELHQFLATLDFGYCDPPPDDEPRMIDLEWCDLTLSQL